LQSLSLALFVYPQVSTFWISLVALLFSSAFVYFVAPLRARERILALVLLYVTLSIPFEPLVAKRVYALPGNYKVYPAGERSPDSLISSGPKWQRLLTEDSTQQVYAVFSPDYAIERLAMQCASRIVEVTATKGRPIRLWSDFTLRIQSAVPECRLKDMEALYGRIDSLMGQHQHSSSSVALAESSSSYQEFNEGFSVPEPEAEPSCPERKERSIAFVGEKINLSGGGISGMDHHFFATYRILQMVHGPYSDSIISFDVYDHYGTPGFAKFKTVLLYVSGCEGHWYHEKYMYSPVSKTTNGRWAGPYEQKDYDHSYNQNSQVKPERLSFSEPKWLPVSDYMDEEDFPTPYYKVKDGVAYVIWGNYVEDLFKLKKGGYLKARGVF
jgi:hypothetical protein